MYQVSGAPYFSEMRAMDSAKYWKSVLCRTGVGALRTVESEARALAARDRERGDFARAEDFHALRDRLGVKLVLFGGLCGVGEERGGREVGGDGCFRALQDVSGDEAGEGFPVDHAELRFEFGLCGGVRRVVMREQMRLSRGFHAFSEGFLHVVFLHAVWLFCACAGINIHPEAATIKRARAFLLK